MNFKKAFAAILSVVLILGVVPAPVFADVSAGGYVLMNIPYAEFYAGEGVENVDAVTSATKKAYNSDLVAGFYHGPDGNNYVALGTYNTKESKTKVVIRVIKYSKAWKKGKTLF